MNSTNRIAVIIEGAAYEKKIIRSIKSHFFTKDNKATYTIIPLPMAGNIYILWKELQRDNDLDIIELIRERTPETQKALEGFSRDSFGEIYLFFDYDSQQNNLAPGENSDDVLLDMLDTFDNETENGKLYISYPMAEAIRDSVIGNCKSFSGTCYYQTVGKEYKTLSGDNNNPLSHIGNYTQNKWYDFVNIYRGRISCLYRKSELISLHECKMLTVKDIHLEQLTHKTSHGGLIVLSAFSRFIIDYFKEEDLSNWIDNRDFNYLNCK